MNGMPGSASNRRSFLFNGSTPQISMHTLSIYTIFLFNSIQQLMPCHWLLQILVAMYFFFFFEKALIGLLALIEQFGSYDSENWKRKPHLNDSFHRRQAKIRRVGNGLWRFRCETSVQPLLCAQFSLCTLTKIKHGYSMLLLLLCTLSVILIFFSAVAASVH